MYPYLEIHREHLLQVLIYGGIGFFGLALALGARYLVVGRPQDPKEEVWERFPGGLLEGRGRMPWFLVALYVSVGIWALCYVAAFAFWGVDFN